MSSPLVSRECLGGLYWCVHCARRFISAPLRGTMAYTKTADLNSGRAGIPTHGLHRSSSIRDWSLILCRRGFGFAPQVSHWDRGRGLGWVGLELPRFGGHWVCAGCPARDGSVPLELGGVIDGPGAYDQITAWITSIRVVSAGVPNNLYGSAEFGKLTANCYLPDGP